MDSRGRAIHYTTLLFFHILISSTTLLAQCDATKYAEKFEPQNQNLPKSQIERENNNLSTDQPLESATTESEPSESSPTFLQPNSGSVSLSPKNSPPLFCVYPNPPPQISPPHSGNVNGPKPGPSKPTPSPPASEPKNPKFAVWCVAKPTVPSPALQQALDYACGTRADCRPIGPNGPCFQPNTLLAHASYAFNSYFQRTKQFGGTCDFGGTAMLVTADPRANWPGKSGLTLAKIRSIQSDAGYDGCNFLFT